MVELSTSPQFGEAVCPLPVRKMRPLLKPTQTLLPMAGETSIAVSVKPPASAVLTSTHGVAAVSVDR